MGKGFTLSDRPPQRLWESTLGQLELQVTRPNFETWLRGTEGLRYQDRAIVVGVRSDFALEWLRTRMSAAISRTVSQVAGAALAVEFEVLGVTPSMPDQPNDSDPETRTTRHTLVTQPNRRLTFESFAVVRSNQLAVRAARRFIDDPASPQPLTIWSAPALGRTHLLHAIAHECAARDLSYTLVTGEAFVREYGTAVREGRPHTFSAQFRSINVLLVDDLQFMATRKGSQDQFLQTFNALHAANKRIAVTLDARPQDTRGFSAGLVSRLSGGLCVNMDRPGPDERLAILQSKGTSLPDDALRAISAFPADHVRDLEGSLHRVEAYLDLTGAAPNASTIAQALHPFQPPASPSDHRAIVLAICRRFQLAAEDLSGQSRARDVTYARHLAMYLLQKRSRLPYAEIGRILGGRDHSTVLSGCKRIERELATLPSTKADVVALDEILSGVA
jgi:chromosomal replication initiator protein